MLGGRLPGQPQPGSLGAHVPLLWCWGLPETAPHPPSPGWVAEEVGGASQGLGEWGRAGLGTLIPERPPPGSGAHGRCGAGLPALRLGARPHRGPPALGVRCVPARSWVTGGCGWCWPRDAFPCPGVALRSDCGVTVTRRLRGDLSRQSLHRGGTHAVPTWPRGQGAEGPTAQGAPGMAGMGRRKSLGSPPG